MDAGEIALSQVEPGACHERYIDCNRGVASDIPAGCFSTAMWSENVPHGSAVRIVQKHVLFPGSSKAERETNQGRLLSALMNIVV